MPIIMAADLGTTTITALALDTDSGAILACRTAPNRAETTPAAGRIEGRSEWDVAAIAATACTCLRDVAEQIAGRRSEVAGIGITGQQHGVVILDSTLAPLTPFVNWQDRRGEQTHPGSGQTYVARVVGLAGPDAPRRTGCRLAAGYLGVTLFWIKETAALPSAGTACFVPDYFAARLTGRAPVTDATLAASSGLFDVSAGDWDRALPGALGLPRALLPEVRPSGEPLGGVSAGMAAETGLPAGVPVCVGIGDNQASFLGSVAERNATLLVNVGTGGQVVAYTERFVHDPLLETRPFPRGGYLLVSAGLSGGAAYAVLERFFRTVTADVAGVPAAAALYPAMNRLAAAAPPGARGLRCEPFFTGTRHDPALRASWSDVSAENFTPACMTRALLEGMARTFGRGRDLIARHADQDWMRLVGAGNGLRENPVLAQIVSEELALPLAFPVHREEAACGAALLAAVGTGIFPDLAAAGRLIRYDTANSAS
jgi:sugar (pentulose or hexulose) kinase